MSIGHGAHGKLLRCDDEQIEYAYCSFDVNKPNYEEKREELDGIIVLDASIFKIIDSYRRYKGDVSDTERAALRLSPDELDCQTLRSMGMVQIMNSSGAWIMDKDGTDRHAVRLVNKIIAEYSKKEKIPQIIGLYY